MSTPPFHKLRLSLVLAGALTSLGALGAGSPTVSFSSSLGGGAMTGVGTSYTFPFDPLLVNGTSSPAVISAITLGGADAGQFTMSGSAVAPCVVGGTIARSGSAVNFCGLHFSFNPTSLGVKVATVTVTLGNGTAASFPVAAEGLVPNPVVDVLVIPNPVPDTAVGATSPGFRSAYVSNRGAQGLVISNYTISGPNAADFSFAGFAAIHNAAECTAIPVINYGGAPPGVNCQIGVSFRPSALGLRSAVITLATNDPARPIVTFALAGNGVVAPPPPPPAAVLSAVYVTDLWGNPGEPAWSLNIVHHKVLVVNGPGTDAVVATWNTFNASNAPTWFSLSGGSWTTGQSYTGVLHQTTGSYFGNAYVPGQAVDSIVGSATLSFTDANNGTLSYTVAGITSSRAIIRKAF
jgi:hypothetical protein